MKNWLLTLCMIMYVTFAIAQFDRDTDEEVMDDKKLNLSGLVLGGNLALGYSNGWNINLSPTVGYRLMDNTIAGVGISYWYSSYNGKSVFNPYPSKTNIVGARAFIQQLLAFNVYVHAEYEYLSGAQIIYDRNGNVLQTADTAAPGVLVGGGYSSSFGIGPAYNIEVLYNIIHTIDTPYSSPLVIRFGYTFGFE